MKLFMLALCVWPVVIGTVGGHYARCPCVPALLLHCTI